MATPAEPASDRVRLRRGAIRAEYDRAGIFEVLDAGLIAHVGVVTDAGPIVLPMAYGRTDEWLYVHGSVANAALRAAVGQDICITVTIVDGMVVGRCPFHNSMNYRGVVVRGVARRVEDPDEHVAALRLVSDHVMPTWDTAREPNATEIRQTMVVAVPLVEMSAKIRGGDPIDEPEDVDGPHWAGHVPIRSVWESPVDCGRPASGHRPAGRDLRPGRAAGVTRRNRVDPWGDLHADPARGLLTGNRGCLVDDDRRVVRHHKSSTLWITCLLRFKDWRHPLDQPHVWTPLFFLDDAVALAAGHRPCATCRRADYVAYRDAVDGDGPTLQGVAARPPPGGGATAARSRPRSGRRPAAVGHRSRRRSPPAR